MRRGVHALVRAALVTVCASSAAGASPGVGDAARGKRVFQLCYSCHSVDPNEPAMLQGPSLYRILERPAAAISGFEYSTAMELAAAAGLVWDAATLDAYIVAPDAVVPGTLMSSPPLREAQDRADLIAYLALSGPFKP
jgi:cytochrome c